MHSFTGVKVADKRVKDLHNEHNVVSPERPHDDKRDGWAVGVGRTEQFHNSDDGWLAAAAVPVMWTTVAFEAAPCRRFIRSG